MFIKLLYVGIYFMRLLFPLFIQLLFTCFTYLFYRNIDKSTPPIDMSNCYELVLVLTFSKSTLTCWGAFMRVNGNERLLALMKILEEETDEENQLDMKEVVEKLKMYFLDKPNFDTRALKRDIRALDDNGFEVIVNEGRFGKNLYSHQGRLFETYQLRLLSDAVLSARFITEMDKQSIVKKL